MITELVTDFVYMCQFYIPQTFGLDRKNFYSITRIYRQGIFTDV